MAKSRRQESAEGLYQQAVNAYHAKNFDTGAELCRLGLKANKKHLPTIQLLGIFLAETRQYEAACAQFKKYCKLDSNNAEVWYARGLCHQNLDQKDSARGCYQKAISINPNHVNAMNNLALILRDEEKYEEAADLFIKVVSLHPQHAEGHCNLGLMLWHQHLYKQSIAHLDEALRLRPRYPAALKNKALVLQTLDFYNDSREHLKRAIAFDPEYADAHFLLGESHYAQDDFEEAIKHFKMGVTADPAHIASRERLAMALHQAGRVEDARAEFDLLQKEFVSAADGLVKVGYAYKQLGDIDQAMRHFRKAIEAAPENPYAYYHLVNTRSFRGDSDYFDPIRPLLECVDADDWQRVYAAFAIGKAHEDLDQPELAMPAYLKGNRLKRELVTYDADLEQAQVDRLKSAFTPEFVERLGSLAVEDETPLFILGMPRSGTTLVEQILDSHSEVHGAGELASLPASCQFLVANSEERWMDALHRASDSELREVAQRYLYGLEQRLRTGERFVTDKLPENFKRVGLILGLMPKAKVVHCIRDKVQNSFANFKCLFHEGNQPHSFDMEELAQYHNNYRELMEIWRKLFPGKIYDLNYETLVNEPDTEIRKLLGYCGLPFQDACLAFHENKRAVGTVSAAQVRQPMYKGAVSRADSYLEGLAPMLAKLEEYPG